MSTPSKTPSTDEFLAQLIGSKPKPEVLLAEWDPNRLENEMTALRVFK
jgi:hypothetical protein